jgi:NAD(P)-dependent dehydrogenase (short-subunit alcohol dehydrogenase family)
LESFVVDYTDATVLVTGAASGIGAALASQLNDRGAHVICADRDSKGLADVVASIGSGATAMTCDLSDPGAAGALIEQSFALSNRLDLVCSNAGFGFARSVLDEDMENASAVSRLFEVNLFSGLKIAQAYGRRLADTGQRGRLMVTASENSLSLPSAVKRSKMAFYGATKHALLIAMEWMRIDPKFADMDLHVLMPGAVYTALISPMLPNPADAAPELGLIMPEQCADIALRGMDHELFYIPTHGHFIDDMQPRLREIEDAMTILNVNNET